MCYLYWIECGNKENEVSLKLKTIALRNKTAQILSVIRSMKAARAGNLVVSSASCLTRQLPLPI